MIRCSNMQAVGARQQRGGCHWGHEQSWEPRQSAAAQLCAGLVTTMAAKALGAGRVAVVDMNQANLEVHAGDTAAAERLLHV
jgi:hypothetical protein